MKDASFKERRRLPEAERERQARPVRSLMKSRVVYRTEPVNPVAQAYLKLLRERGDARLMPVDPFCEVYRFRENVYGLYFESLDGHGDVWSYLVVGEEKCLLIDTAFGLGDLKGLVDELGGGRKVIVVNTHSHMDHAYGDFQFDEVFLHEYEAPEMRRVDAHAWDYLFSDDGEPIWCDFDRRDLIPFRKVKFTGVPSGYTFDLGGGHVVELIHLGGHTVGSAAFLDRKSRILFGGDDLCVGVGMGALREGMAHPECVTLRFFSERVDELLSREAEYDYVFPQHGITDMESAYVGILSELLHESLASPEGGDGFARVDEKYRPCRRCLNGIQISYHPGQVSI